MSMPLALAHLFLHRDTSAAAKADAAPSRTAGLPADTVSASDRRSIRRRLLVWISLSLLAILGAILGGILYFCDGHLFYSFDDAYISLSLGWHLAHGTYGINPGEVASPSSSVLYPLLLAAFAWSRWQDWAPLVINAAAAICTALLLGGALCRYAIVRNRSKVATGVILVVLVSLTNFSIFAVFVGLEHSLHLLTSVFVVLALARVLEEGTVPPTSLILAIVLLPLWRFEGIALAGLAVVTMVLAGYRRPAIIAALGIAAALGVYTAAMHALGLPLLPSSVLSKSAVARQAMGGIDQPGGLLTSIFDNVSQQFSNRQPIVLSVAPLSLLIGLVVAHPLLRVMRPETTRAPAWPMRQEGLFVAVAAGAMIAQFILGARGDRYDAYAYGIGTAGALVLWRDYARKLVEPGHWLLGCAVFALFAYVGHFFVTTVATPFAARGHYEQQYQMGLFAREFYRAPVAVNDLGLVSYRNPYYVLDLAGLGSEAAREARLDAASDPYWMSRLIERRHIGLAMVFRHWFPRQIPPGWRRIAVLHTPPRPTIIASGVSFYATSRGAVAPAVTALRRFRRELIPGTSLTIFGDGAAQDP
jgi:hypothetical protein